MTDTNYANHDANFWTRETWKPVSFRRQVRVQCPNPIAALIRQQRQEQGMSALQLSRRIGAYPAYVTQIETGRLITPSETYMLRLSDVLHIKVAVLAAACQEARALQEGLTDEAA